MKTSWAALIFSLSIHAFFGYSFYCGTSAFREPPSQEPIQIAYVQYEKPVMEEKIAVRAPKVAPKSLLRKKDTLRLPDRPATKKTEERPTKAPAAKPVTGPASVSLPQRPRTAVDFMTDPQKGKIFFDYFGKLKEKIHLNLRRKYRNMDDSLGVVTLYFVLNPDGSLAKVGVVEKESDAGVGLQKIALDSLRRSAPFGGFPHDLGNGPVAFNLKVYFDDLE